MKQFLIKITIFVVTSLYLNCQAPNKPYSFKNSIFNLKEISEIELLETNTPDFQSINKYIDSIDNKNILHPEFYGSAFIRYTTQLEISNDTIKIER